MSIPVSPPAPQDISTYSRFIHDHTKRQMEAFGGSPPPRSSTSSVGSRHKGANGTSPTEYHS